MFSATPRSRLSRLLFSTVSVKYVLEACRGSMRLGSARQSASPGGHACAAHGSGHLNEAPRKYRALHQRSAQVRPGPQNVCSVEHDKLGFCKPAKVACCMPDASVHDSTLGLAAAITTPNLSKMEFRLLPECSTSSRTVACCTSPIQ